jgi:hypothetical protein
MQHAKPPPQNFYPVIEMSDGRYIALGRHKGLPLQNFWNWFDSRSLIALSTVSCHDEETATETLTLQRWLNLLPFHPPH